MIEYIQYLCFKHSDRSWRPRFIAPFSPLWFFISCWPFPYRYSCTQVMLNLIYLKNWPFFKYTYKYILSQFYKSPWYHTYILVSKTSMIEYSHATLFHCLFVCRGSRFLYLLLLRHLFQLLCECYHVNHHHFHCSQCVPILRRNIPIQNRRNPIKECHHPDVSGII